MLEALSVRPRICKQIRSGPLGRWVDDFVDVLSTRGYATSTMRRYVRAAAIFSAWLDRQRVAATDIDETLVTRFVTGLPRRPSATRQSGRLSGCGRRRPFAGRSSVDARCGCAQRLGLHSRRDRAVAATLRRSSRASARAGCRNPADLPPLRRRPSCRMCGDANARLVPAHRADDRGVCADPDRRSLPVVAP